MRIFISYSSKERSLTQELVTDLRLMRHDAWFDQELVNHSGQEWWALICDNLVSSNLVIIVVSPNWLASVPCQLEYEYAQKLNKRVLPLMIASVQVEVLGKGLQKQQILNYIDRSDVQRMALASSIENLPPEEPLPIPLPARPPTPLQRFQTTMIYEITRGIPSSLSPSLKIIRYGKCRTSPYAENDLWYVNLPAGWFRDRYDNPALKMFYEPTIEHTFLVDASKAKPIVFEELQRSVELWQKEAHRVFLGDWCVRYEMLWKELPIKRHTLPDGINVKYGYCRTQSYKHPERELWFVSLDNGSTFVVDEICARPEFMDKMGSNWLRWVNICWCHLESEVKWSELESYADPSYVTTNDHFHLDSPYIQESLEDLSRIIEMLINE